MSYAKLENIILDLKVYNYTSAENSQYYKYRNSNRIKYLPACHKIGKTIYLSNGMKMGMPIIDAIIADAANSIIKGIPRTKQIHRIVTDKVSFLSK